VKYDEEISGYYVPDHYKSFEGHPCPDVFCNIFNIFHSDFEFERGECGNSVIINWNGYLITKIFSLIVRIDLELIDYRDNKNLYWNYEIIGHSDFELPEDIFHKKVLKIVQEKNSCEAKHKRNIRSKNTTDTEYGVNIFGRKIKRYRLRKRK
jgi:hypothetical protein